MKKAKVFRRWYEHCIFFSWYEANAVRPKVHLKLILFNLQLCSGWKKGIVNRIWEIAPLCLLIYRHRFAFQRGRYFLCHYRSNPFPLPFFYSVECVWVYVPLLTSTVQKSKNREQKSL